MDILGVSCYFHDAAAALLRDGQLVAAVEEERFSRKKHDYGFPPDAIDFCLRAGGIPASALDYVVFFEKPFLKFERLLLTCMQTFPRTRQLFQEAMIPWLGDKVWIRHLLQKRLGVPPSRILFSEHHLSHAASAFYCLALRRGRDPHGGRRRGMDDRHHRALDAAPSSRCWRRSGSRTRSGSSTAPSPRSSGSRSTRASTRSWAWRPSGRRGTSTTCGS